MCTPDHGEAAVIQTGDFRLRAKKSGSRHQRPNAELGGERRTGAVIDPAGYLVCGSAGFVGPDNNKAVAVQRNYRRLITFIVAVCSRADLELGRRGGSVGIEHTSLGPRHHAAGLILPGHDKSAICKRGDRRTGFGVSDFGCHQELGSILRAIGVVTLPIDTVVAAVLAIRSPNHDIAAIAECRNGRVDLIAGAVGIDRTLN